MNKPLDEKLYQQVKKMADIIFVKPSAYKSGWIVKTYKKQGGEYSGSKTKEGLTAWFKAKWRDIGDKNYPVYRPTVRVNKRTPLTVSEIDPKNLQEQIKLKQKLRGRQNLPPFKRI
jgi:hypothetical protein